MRKQETPWAGHRDMWPKGRLNLRSSDGELELERQWQLDWYHDQPTEWRRRHSSENIARIDAELKRRGRLK